MENNTIKQWISEVVAFSSEYEDSRWAATQVIGPPKMYPEYNSMEGGSWSQSQFSLTDNEFIEVKFPKEVFVKKLNIYETNHCGGIVNIKLKNKIDWVSVWHAENGPTLLYSSRIFTPRLIKTKFKTNHIRIELDCTVASSYCSIDAVELVGKLFNLKTEKTLSLNLKNLIKTEEFYDVQFKVEDKIINAHANIFATRSAFFRKLLIENFEQNNFKQKIKLKEISYDAFKSLMYYLYTDHLEENTSTFICCELIRSNSIYALENLNDVCILFIKKKLDLNNIISTLVSAVSIEPQLENVKMYCMKFIALNFNQILKLEEFRSLEKEILVEITKYYAQFF